MSPKLPPNPHTMSSVTRGYLVVASVVHFLPIGLTILFIPELYISSVFTPIVQYTHLWIWGSAYTLVGLICGVAAITAFPTYARVGLIAAFVVLLVSSFAVGWGVVRTWIDNDLPLSSPVVPLAFLALGLKDLIMVRKPLRTVGEDADRAEHEQGNA